MHVEPEIGNLGDAFPEFVAPIVETLRTVSRVQYDCFPCSDADRANGARAGILYHQRLFIYRHGEIIVNGLLRRKVEAERYVLVLGARIREAVISTKGDRVRAVP